MAAPVPLSVVSAFGFAASSSLSPLEGGLINQTYLVEEAGRRGVLQRLNAIFVPAVHLDIEAITAHLAHKGMLTPRLLPTTSGALWTRDAEGGVWRMLTWLEGRTLRALERPETARAAGLLVARFHEATRDLVHTFHFTRPGVHDTAAHLERLRGALDTQRGHPNYERVAAVAEAILRHAEALEALPTLPARIAHGDLKISNLLFDEACEQGLALLDLDTMAHLPIPIELGDAFRSWCNPSGEDEARASFRAQIFEAAIAGYAERARPLLSADEVSSLVLGAQQIALELATRFCTDALYERYFGWNPDKFPTRSEHNLARAKSQLSVAESVRGQRAALEAIVTRHLRGGGEP